MSNGDLDALANGFSLITIGRIDGSGAMSFGSNLTFKDPVLLQMPTGLGSINTSGGGQTAQEGMELRTGQTLTLGALTINANNLRATSSQGRVVVNGTLNNTGSGEVILSGNNTGLVTSPGIQVNSNILTNGGNITLTGTTSETSAGINIQSGILSSGGDVSITGTSSQGIGLLVSPGGFVNATTGDVSLSGISLGTGTLVHGIYLSSGSQFGNNITITGNSSGSVTSDGVLVSGGSTLSATSDLTIGGTGTTGVKFFNAGSVQGTNNFSIIGTSTTNTDDILIDNSTLYAGALNLNANQFHFLNGATFEGLVTATSNLNLSPINAADNLTVLFNSSTPALTTSNFAQVTIGKGTGTGAISLRNDVGGVSNLVISNPLLIQSPGGSGTIDTTGVNLQGDQIRMQAGTSITTDALTANNLILTAGNSITTGNITSTAATNMELTAPSVTVGTLQANPITGNPTIVLTGDEINFATIASSGGLLTLRPLTTTQLINLGNADTGLGGTLDFTATDLTNLQAGFAGVTIGRTNGTGTVQLGTGFTLNTPTTIVGSGFSLQGSNTATTFTLSSNTAGSINGGNITIASGASLNFSGVSGIQAGIGNDAFNLLPGFVATLSLDGGAGSDLLDYGNFTTAVNVDLGAGSATNVTALSNVENFRGGSASDQFLLPTGDNAVNLTAAAAGIVNGTNTFTSFEAIVGNTGNDTFTLADGVSFGQISGGSGTDTPY